MKKAERRDHRQGAAARQRKSPSRPFPLLGFDTDNDTVFLNEKLRTPTQVTLDDLARELNPMTRGWIAYYGRYTRSALYPLVRYIDQTLAVWLKRKYKRFHHRLGQARLFLAKIARESPRIFVHWQLGLGGALA